MVSLCPLFGYEDNGDDDDGGGDDDEIVKVDNMYVARHIAI